MKYLILGASASGVNCAKTIRELDPHGEITMVSKDKNIYSRCMLHHVIGGTKNIKEINFVEEEFSENYKINWVKNTAAIQLNIQEKMVMIEDNRQIEYDKLLIATGASSFIPPVKNLREGKGIHGLRNIEDAFTIKEEAKNVKNVAVLGAGLVGIDAAIGLSELDLNISVIEMADRILPLQLDRKASARYEKLFQKEDMRIYTCVKAEEVMLDEDNRVKGIRLSDGRLIECEMIVVATGVRPNISFIMDKTIELDRGIVINNKCETNIKDIYAAGDVTGKSPIWPLAVKQGIVAAYNMTGSNKALDDLFSLRNSMNFLELQTVSLGIIEAPDESYNTSIEEYGDNYKKIIHKDGIIKGAIIQGDISYCGVLTHLIKNEINISNINKDIFDISYSDFFGVKEDGEYEYIV